MRFILHTSLCVLIPTAVMSAISMLPPAAHAETRGDVPERAGRAAPAREARGDREGGRSRFTQRWQDATPAERRAIRSRARDRFESATPGQRRRTLRRLRRLERALPEFSPIERLLLLRAVAELPREEQASLRKRVGGIDDLEPAERRALMAELEGLVRSFDGEVERLERNRDRWEGMSEAEREEYRVQMKRLRSMSVEERRALFEEMEKSKKGGNGGKGGKDER